MSETILLEERIVASLESLLMEDESDEDNETQDNIPWSSQIPDLVLTLIFSYLTCDVDLIHAAMVCQYWKTVAYSRALWSNIKVKLNAQANVMDYIDIFKERGVQKITIRNKALRYCSNPSNVEHAAKQIYTVTHEMQDSLEALDLHDLVLEDHHIISAFDQPMLNLKSVGLHCYGFYTEISICTIIKQCKQLRALTHNKTLTPTIIKSYGQCHVSKLIGRLKHSLTREISISMPNIVHLDLSRSFITDDGIRNIAQLQKLRGLFLSYCYYLTEECIDILSEAKTPIKELDLRWCARLKLPSLFKKIGNSNLYLEKLLVTSSRNDALRGDSIPELVCNGRACNLRELAIGGIMHEITEETKEMLKEKCKNLKSVKVQIGTLSVKIGTELQENQSPFRLPFHLSHLSARDAFVHIIAPLFDPLLPAHFRADLKEMMNLSEESTEALFRGDELYRVYEKSAEDSKKFIQEVKALSRKQEKVSFQPPSVPEPSVPEPSVPEPSVPEPSVPEPSGLVPSI